VTIHNGKKPGEYRYIKWDEKIDAGDLSKINKALESIKVDPIKTDADDEFSMFFSEKPVYTGKNLYRDISKRLGSDKAASEFLLKSGIDGIDYPAGSLSGVKSSARNYVVFDPEAVTIDAINGEKIR
jgi:hypothetical protein